MSKEQVADDTHPYMQELIKKGDYQPKVCGRVSCVNMRTGGTPLVNHPINGWYCPNCGEEYHIIERRKDNGKGIR